MTLKGMANRIFLFMNIIFLAMNMLNMHKLGGEFIKNQNTYQLQTVYVNNVPYEIAMDFRKATE